MEARKIHAGPAERGKNYSVGTSQDPGCSPLPQGNSYDGSSGYPTPELERAFFVATASVLAAVCPRLPERRHIETSMMDERRLASMVLPVFLGRICVERLSYIDIQDEREDVWPVSREAQEQSARTRQRRQGRQELGAGPPSASQVGAFVAS